MFALLLGVLLSVHLLLSLGLAGSFTPDDSDQVLFSQSLAWGYYEQPPLYSWLTYLFFHFFGLSFFTYCLLKSVVLGLIYVAVFQCARWLFDDQRMAVPAAFSPFLIPTFAWHSFSYLTNSNLVCAIGAGTCYFLLRLQRKGGWFEYFSLGVMLGLGMLSKYNYLFFAAALFLAGLTIPNFRARLLHRRILMTLGIGTVMIVPHALWLFDHKEALITVLSQKFAITSTGSIADRISGVFSLISNVFLILLPAAIVLWLLFGREARAVRPSSDGERLLERFFFAVLVLLLVFVILGGATRFHERWLQPFVLLVPLWALSRLGLSSPRQLRRLSCLLAGSVLLCSGIRAGQLFFGGFDRGTYPLQMNFSLTVQQLRDVINPGAVVVASDREISGNLRYQLPQARHLCSEHPLYVPPLDNLNGPRVLVWNTLSGDKPPLALRTFAAQALQLELPEDARVCFVEVPAKLPGRRSNRLGYVVVSDFARRK